MLVYRITLSFLSIFHYIFLISLLPSSKQASAPTHYIIITICMDLEIPSELVYTIAKRYKIIKTILNCIMLQFKLQHNDIVKAYYGVAAE